MKIVSIEGIGPVYAEKLVGAGIKTVEALLDKGAGRKGREDLAELTGITEKLILEWVNLADLMRIKGIGEEYSDLLEEAGVDTVKELKNRNPENLYKAMVETNQEKKLVRRVPTLKEVQKWVAEAAQLESRVTY
jgi:predicted flap endonuclease-1-like 5' DNA nuclease